MENKQFNFQSNNAIKEYVMVMHLSNGTKVRAKTGSLDVDVAMELAYEGILFVEENFGPIVFWNWEGEETVIRTVNSAFPPIKEVKRGGILNKISNFINVDDVSEVERIRRRNALKEKFASFKAKIDAFFEFEADDNYEDVEIPTVKPTTLKEKLIYFFYEDIEIENK